MNPRTCQGGPSSHVSGDHRDFWPLDWKLGRLYSCRSSRWGGRFPVLEPPL